MRPDRSVESDTLPQAMLSTRTRNFVLCLRSRLLVADHLFVRRLTRSSFRTAPHRSEECVQTFLRAELQAKWTVTVGWTRSKGRIMKPSNFAVVLGVAAAMLSISSHADDHHKKSRGNHRVHSGMRAVVTGTKSGQPGYGWRYFADAREGRAVVISPGGDYFYSQGNGLALVYKATSAVSLSTLGFASTFGDRRPPQPT
jgi:hypothetical protein